MDTDLFDLLLVKARILPGRALKQMTVLYASVGITCTYLGNLELKALYFFFLSKSRNRGDIELNRLSQKLYSGSYPEVLTFKVVTSPLNWHHAVTLTLALLQSYLSVIVYRDYFALLIFLPSCRGELKTWRISLR